MAYVGADGFRVDGVRAFARALEHIHLGWTVVAWLLLTPGIAQLAQLLVDARGAARLGAPSR